MSSITNDQWVQYCYDHQSMEGSGGGDHIASSIEFSDSVITTTTTTSTTTSDHHHHQYHNHLSPKGCGSKPVRRRSRASKKTPTTLLNANTTNFRDLVQQFTGCPSTPFSFGNKKGPVNLSFGHGSSNYNDHEQGQSQQQRYAASVEVAFGNNNNNHFYQQHYYQPQKHLQQHQDDHQQVYSQDHQQSHVSFDDYNCHDDGFLTKPSSGNCLEIPDGFDMDEISMHEITTTLGSAFSSDDRNNSAYPL